MATYSAPPSSGLLYRTHSPGCATTPWPACTSRTPCSCSTRSIPRNTTVISSKSGRCPGSTHPSGDTIRATLTSACPEFTRPAYSSIRLGLFPAAATTVGPGINVGTTGNYTPFDHVLTRPRLALILFLALSIVHTWPLGSALGSKSLNHNTDAQQWAWTLAWIAHAIAHDPLNLFNGNVFAPETNVLTYSDPVIVPALMGATARWLGASPVLTFNLVVIAGLTLTAWAGWLVAWTWTGSNRGALVAGALTAFNAHLLTRLPHVPAAHSWGLPLTLYLRIG